MPLFDLQAPREGMSSTFANADAARTWLAAQSQAVPLRIMQSIAEQLDALLGTQHDGMVRATILEALRNAALTAQGAARRKFAFQPRPLAGEAASVFTASRRVGLLIAANYLRCVEEFAGQSPADPVKLATAAHRAMVTLRLLCEDFYLAGNEVPATVWNNLQRLLALARSHGVDQLDIIDPEVRDPSNTTLAAQYAVLVLLALSDPYRLNGAQFTVLQRALFRWRDLPRLGDAPDDSPRARWIPLGALSGDAAEGLRWLDVSAVRAKLKGRIKALDDGESPESLQLGRDLSARACRDFLDSILDAMRVRKSTSGTAPASGNLRVAAGFEESFVLLGGKAASSGGAPQSLAASRVANERMAIFGDPSAAVAAAPPPAAGESWQLIEESVEAETLYRPADAPGNARLLTGQLVAVGGTAGHSATLGVVTRTLVDGEGGLRISVRRFPGQPTALSATSASNAAPMAFSMFLLPGVPALQVEPSAILPSGTAIRLRQAIRTNGQAEPIQLGTLLERGNDFERYALG